MREFLSSRLIALAVLAAFVIASCGSPVSPSGPEPKPPPPSLGFVFLDENYSATINDTGRIGMFVENSKDAEGVLIVAEIQSNHIDNDMIVRIIDGAEGTIVSMIYSARAAFPRSIAVTAEEGGEEVLITGEFTANDLVAGTFSVSFHDGEETEVMENIALNLDILNAREKSSEFSSTLNARLGGIMTSLAIWDSLARELQFDGLARGKFTDGLRKALSGVFRVVAKITAFVAVVVEPYKPALASALTMVSKAANLIADLIYPEGKTPHKPGHENPAENDLRPEIEIRLNGDKLINNDDSVLYYPTDPITFNIEIVDYGSLNGQAISQDIIILSENFYLAVDPDTGKIIPDGEVSNASFLRCKYSLPYEGASDFTVYRHREGSADKGGVKFVIQFGVNVIINGVDESGYVFSDGALSPSKAPQGNLFVLNFTALHP